MPEGEGEVKVTIGMVEERTGYITFVNIKRKNR